MAANNERTTVTGIAESPATQPILELRGATKRFGGATALDHVDFALMPGEIHGLIGENGAGKSTLSKILSGVQRPDSGEMRVRGSVVHFRSPAEAQVAGIGMIYQELTLMPALSVAENVFLGRQPRNKFGLVDWKRIRTESKQRLADFGIEIDVDERVKQLSLGNQQLIEIARVIDSGADIIILDEPTSALSIPESERLFELMRELRANGKSMIFISHFLEDVLAVADTVTVLRNGRKVATKPVAELTKHTMVNLMIGREDAALADSYEQGTILPARIETPAVLELINLSAPGAYHNISFTLHEGEILGLFGYLGAGMTEIARSLFGMLKPRSGTITLDGKPIKLSNPVAAKKLGIAYLTENRRATLFPRQEIYKNITLAHLDHLVKPVFRQDSEIGQATTLVQRTGVRPGDPTMLAGQLSGGNQQKVVLAKWLTKQPRVLILNEPTRGMDVGAKREVLDLMQELKTEGVSILLLSTEPETILTESDRILVLSRGTITREFADEQVSKEDLLLYA